MENPMHYKKVITSAVAAASSVIVLLAGCATPPKPRTSTPTVAPVAPATAAIAAEATQEPTAVPSTPAPAPITTRIKFTLDWAIEGPSAPYLVALDKGYFAQEGLAVSIDRGMGMNPHGRIN